jgi:diguanylate cyclase (GGDEF)-like protein
MAGTASHPSFFRPSLFALTWQACVWIGWAVLVWSVVQLNPDALRAMGAPLAMIVAVVILSELRPVVMTRLVGNPVSIALAFVFATMYVWGIAPAAILMAVSVILGEVLQRKPLWKQVFNVGQYVLSISAAWLVVVVAGAAATPLNPQEGLSGSDLWWIVGSWAAYHLVNLAFVAGLAAANDQTWWESFTEEFWFYTVSVAAVLALSPLIAVVALADVGSWAFLPLLLLPLLAVQKAAEMSRENEHQALHDPLTNLPNRLLLADRIDQALARSSRVSGRVAVLFLDLDMFKVVNDSLGHAAGDGLLVETARRLGSVLRPGDTLARFGGDEFVIVCENVPMEEVERLAWRAARALREPFIYDGRDVSVTASVGIAVSAEDTDADTMLRDADAALYRAKAGGRNRAVVFDEEMHEEASARLDAELGLRRALDNGELRIHYQPVVRIPSGAVVGFEALVRWDHPERGVIGPHEFVSVAEETGLILPLGAWVLEQSLDQLRRWRQEFPGGQDLWMAVNVSARQLRSTQLIDSLAHALAATGLPPSSVRLEIVESALVDETGPHLSNINGLRALGVHLAVDDFGTGYSSLSYLKSLPVSTVKIDRSFVGVLDSGDPTSRAIVDAIVGMARALDLEVIAEGVESVGQLEVLRGLGVELGQGYLWSRPQEAAELAHWLRARLVEAVTLRPERNAGDAAPHART